MFPHMLLRDFWLPHLNCFCKSNGTSFGSTPLSSLSLLLVIWCLLYSIWSSRSLFLRVLKTCKISCFLYPVKHQFPSVILKNRGTELFISSINDYRQFSLYLPLLLLPLHYSNPHRTSICILKNWSVNLKTF